ncbi:MAG: alcohol dehydrogenase catalytic domain-containing protein [Planctomycetes bacterium]|nr:alcohol dehydrogenase catalytic domain-containing protein [Planctomycetota bacterium]
MSQMKAVQVAKAGGAFEVVDRPIPTPGAGEIRIRVEACGMCHSDVFVKSGQFPGLALPRVPGHEIAGRIDAVGPGVDRRWQSGQRVGVGWYGGHCTACDPCRRGDFMACENGKITGITFDGGYAEYCVVPVQAVARIPDALSAAEAGPLLCAGITTYNALRNSGARPGDTVGVQGIGGLGHLALQYARQMGFRTVAISRGTDKEPLARELGAHDYVDTAKTTAAEGLQQLGGAHLVLATAPHGDAIAGVVDGLRPRGKLLLVAAAVEPIPVSAFSLLSGKAVAGWPSGTSIDSEETMAFSARTGVRPRIERFQFAQAEQAFAKMMANKVRFRAVLEP